MAKRKLVEIEPKKHKAMEQLRKRCKESGVLVPSIPFIVDLALTYGLKPAMQKLEPEQD